MSVQGEIDLYTVPRLQRELTSVLAAGAPRPAVRKILQVTGLEAVFTVIDNPAQAVGS